MKKGKAAEGRLPLLPLCKSTSEEYLKLGRTNYHFQDIKCDLPRKSGVLQQIVDLKVVSQIVGVSLLVSPCLLPPTVCVCVCDHTPASPWTPRVGYPAQAFLKRFRSSFSKQLA